jgi:hypothetical protein
MSSAAELALKKKYALLQKKKQVGQRGGGMAGRSLFAALPDLQSYVYRLPEASKVLACTLCARRRPPAARRVAVEAAAAVGGPRRHLQQPQRRTQPG